MRATGKKQPTKKTQPKGIYRVDCDFMHQYIGETSRPLNVRIKEQSTSVNKLDGKSAIADHIKQNPHHKIQWDKVRTLDLNHSNNTKRKLLEAIQIQRQPGDD